MFRRGVVVAAVVVGLGGVAVAADSPIGLAVAHNKAGVVVAGVGSGTVAERMGFKENDSISGYTFNNRRRPVTKLSDLSELLNGTPGGYVIERAGKPAIAGTLSVRDVGREKVFVFTPQP